jgi:uncharacterized protein (DUF885 family)
VHTVVGQLDEWLAGPYFATFAAAGPDALRGELDSAARAADEAVAGIRDYLRDEYAPRVEGTPDAVGRERYAVAARRWTGSDLGAGSGLEEAYAWGWAEHRRILAEQRTEAGKILPGGTPMEAMQWLTAHGPAVEGVEAIRERLQAMMDEAIETLDGTHFDLAEPVRRVEAMIAPPGSAAAPYYTRPAQDFSRPWAGPGSRSGTWCRSGTTRAFPAITCSWPSGCTSRSSSRPIRRRSVRSARTSRAGRCTPSG